MKIRSVGKIGSGKKHLFIREKAKAGRLLEKIQGSIETVTPKAEYYEVQVTSVGANTPKDSSEGKGQIFSSETKTFKTMDEVKAFIAENYPNRKGQDMFIDTTDGHSVKVGKIFNFWNEDLSHPFTDEGKRNRWYQSDWVEVREVKASPAIEAFRRGKK